MKLDYPKAWFERSALIEGDAEVGAGMAPITLASTKLDAQKTSAFDTRIALGLFVSLWRRNHGWNAEALAAEAGIDTDDLIEIEHDPDCEPEDNTIYKLAAVFGVSPRRLMEVAGLKGSRTSSLRERGVRFPACKEPVAGLTAPEKKALEALMAVLSEKADR